MMEILKRQMLRLNIKIKNKSHIEKADLDHVYEHILGDGNKNHIL